ncbi:unnamed protein product [Arctogadus glacialis]
MRAAHPLKLQEEQKKIPLTANQETSSSNDHVHNAAQTSRYQTNGELPRLRMLRPLPMGGPPLYPQEHRGSGRNIKTTSTSNEP